MKNKDNLYEERKKFSTIVKRILKSKKLFFEGDYVYHYTSGYALKEILKKSILYFTERNSFNDINDKLYADEFILPRKKQYAFCTTTLRDSIHNWSYYGNSCSYCIKLDREKLIEFLSKYDGESGNLYYGPMLYLKSHQIKKLRNEIKKDCNLYNICETEIEEMINEFFYSLIKQSGHSCEKEYRFVYQTDDKPMFREKNGIFIPYIEVYNQSGDQNSRLPIKEIMICPMVNDEIVKTNLKLFLQTTDYKNDNIEITNSELRMRW